MGTIADKSNTWPLRIIALVGIAEVSNFQNLHQSKTLIIYCYKQNLVFKIVKNNGKQRSSNRVTVSTKTFGRKNI